MPKIRAAVLALGVLFPAIAAVGQQAPRTKEEALRHLAATADALKESLPGFACQETAVSERVSGNKVKKRVEFAATVRTRRNVDGVLEESFSASERNGKTVGNGRIDLPFYVGGGFDHAMDYFGSSRQACYRYALNGDRIDFETAPDVLSHPQCRNDELHGFVVLDGDGNVAHLERSVSLEAAQKFHLVPFAAIDFGAVELGGKTFWMSHHLVAEYPQGAGKARFEATYADCKLFAATVKIGPASDATPEDPQGKAPPRHP